MAKKNGKVARPSSRTAEAEDYAGDRAALLAANNGTGDSLDRVRDILFGNQVRDVDRRLEEIEAGFTSEIESLREDLTGRLDTITEALEAAVSDLSEKLGEEHDRATQAEKDLAAQSREDARKQAEDLKQLDADHRERLRATDDRLAEAVAASQQRDEDLGKAADENLATLRDELSTARGEIDQALSTLEESLAGLGEAKTDRAALSQMFADLSERLVEEPAARGRKRS
jgi:ABC-type transporter Mla subunit MlaD